MTTPPINIIAQLDSDPRVCHLTADCDLAEKGSPQPLLQRIIGQPGISGVRLSNGRTIVVEKGDGDNWQDLAKLFGEMIREHLRGQGPDPRQKGPKGHTKFGATFENLWACHRQLDRLAIRVKIGLQRERKRALWALAATSLCGLFAAEHIVEIVFGLLAGLAAGAGAYLTKRSSSPEREHQWLRSRALAEQTKSEAIKFLVRAEPYDKEDAVPKLAEMIQRVRKEMTELGEFEDLDKEDRIQGLPPDWMTMDEYLLNRVKDQSDWYGRKSRIHARDAERLKQIVVAFGIFAAAVGATTMIVGQFPAGSPHIAANQFAWDQFETLLRGWGLASVADAVKGRDPFVIGLIRVVKLMGSGAWIPVFSSLTGAVTTFHYQNRLDFTALVYKQTRAKLEAALAEWHDQVKDAEKPARRSEYVLKFEEILNNEHSQWMAELDKSGGGSPDMGGGMQAPVL